MFVIWIFLGFLVNCYYFYRKHNEYTKRIKEGKLTVKDLCVGFILTLICFPISIYNNEFKNK